MKSFLFCIAVYLFGSEIAAQDIPVLLKEASVFERQQKEPEALEKYKQILLTAPTHFKSLIKATELCVIIGNDQTKQTDKKRYYETALSYAARAWVADSTQADAAYVQSMVAGKMTDVEDENKKIVAHVKLVKRYATKALQLNPNHARANYSLGKWHYEMDQLSGFKKIAVKLFYGGLEKGNMDSAIHYMELCKKADPYFVPNFLDLAKAYKTTHQPAKAIEILNQLVKLPTRTSNDPVLKAEGTALLQTLQ